PTTTTTTPPAALADVAVDLQWVTGGFASPVFVLSRASASGAAGDDRMFVVDQTGTITAFTPPPPGEEPADRSVVLDISERVQFGGEQGLLGAAFHPTSPDRLFVDYTRAEDGATLVEEYSFPVGAEAAEATPVRTILVQPQPAANHNGGMIAFGPDRYLYVALGDGGGGGDTYHNGQDPFTLLGSILRLDVDDAEPYAIPPDSPFADGVDGAPEVWLWGLRYPWRFSFDGADLWIADVGQGAWEEIDVIGPNAGGSNLGWPIFEATHCYDGPCDDPSGFVAPIFEYEHDQGRCSITGGYVYRGTAIPELDGVYLFGDYCSGEIMAIRYADGEVVDSEVYDAGIGDLTSFGLDGDGNLYVTAYDSVYRVVVNG
ncbi:MAG TPA: PQQ-dependent sugar dehydrogenase, partial [Acidimicrobiia bacterium]